MPNIMKKAQQMTTMFPIGLRDDIRVSTTNLSPGALLITLKWRQAIKLIIILSNKARSIGFVNLQWINESMKSIERTGGSIRLHNQMHWGHTIIR